MADVAEAAGISRATLYVHFKDKDALLRALADNVVRESLQHMHQAWKTGAPFGENLEAAILAKDLPLHRLKHTSPHGGELLASNREIARECSQTLEAGFIEFLGARASEDTAGGGQFQLFGGPDGFAVFVAQAAAGFKDFVSAEEPYRTAIHTFATLIGAAIRPDLSERPES